MKHYLMDEGVPLMASSDEELAEIMVNGVCPEIVSKQVYDTAVEAKNTERQLHYSDLNRIYTFL